MNNTQPMFDPITGQPINNNLNGQPSLDSTSGQALNNNLNDQASFYQQFDNSGTASVSAIENSQIFPSENLVTQNQPVLTNEVNIQPQTEIIPIQQAQDINALSTQQQMQNIPTVEQSKQDFISNTQAISEEKKEEKKDEPNIAFIIILFVIIFASIFFLFPFLLKL